jgi:hypothetical protein
MSDRTDTAAEALLERIRATGRDLRRPLAPILEELGGSPPRPTRLIRTIGLDKSLASRLVRSVRSDSDVELMHRVPSPTGLRILAERARGKADGARLDDLEQAADRFQELLDSTPGGRDALESIISESSPEVREKREHLAKQATFKSMSFLLGHFCETLTTSIFLVPSGNGRTVDGLELHRRIGLERMRPSTPLALLSILTPPDEEPPDDSTWIESLDGGLGANPQDFLLPDFSSAPLPELEVVHENIATMFVLSGDPTVNAPARLTSAFRIRNGWRMVPEEPVQTVRGYVLHTPCRTVVRDVFVAEELWAGASPRVSFRLPSPADNSSLADEDRRHPGAVDLTAAIEQLPSGSRAFEIPGVPGNADAVRHLLARSGHAETRFRGWRCAISYPVPLIETLWWLRMPGNGA